MRRTALLIAALLVTARSAHADDDSDETRLSPTTATALSAGTTVAGTAAFIAGLAAPRSSVAGVGVIGGGALMLVGPSTGHWYALDFRPNVGAVLRLGAGTIAMFTVMTNGMVCAVDSLLEDDDATSHHDCSLTRSPEAMTAMFISGAMYIAGAAYDISTARRSVLRENARRSAARRSSSWSIAPMVTPTTKGISAFASF